MQKLWTTLGGTSGDNALLIKWMDLRHLTLDGHCPGSGGKDANANITAGIENCHESYQLEEGRLGNYNSGMSFV
ncbi:hypothetical protein ACNKHU_23390 [Shigella flexneri]